jgi:hypothetical protein
MVTRSASALSNCGHGVAQMMTGYFQVSYPSVVLHALLDSSNGYRLTLVRALLNKEELLAPLAGPHS